MVVELGLASVDYAEDATLGLSDWTFSRQDRPRQTGQEPAGADPCSNRIELHLTSSRAQDTAGVKVICASFESNADQLSLVTRKTVR